MQENILSVDKVTKNYGNHTVLDEISFSLKKGEIVGLVGPNGSGKTTLMSIIVGLTRNYKGNVLFNRENIKTIKNLKKRNIGCVIETPGFYPDLTGYENLKFFSQVFGNIHNEEIDEIINMLGLDNSKNKKVKKYSLGMKQRLGIAQAVLGYPNLVILDEPTNGLDPNIIPNIRQFIKKVAHEKDIAFFISSHVLTEIEAICDKVLLIKNGKLIDELFINSDTKKESDMFILETNNVNELQNFLNTISIDSIVEDNEKVMVELSESGLQQLLTQIIQNGIAIKAVYKQKTSLEEKFLKSIGENVIE